MHSFAGLLCCCVEIDWNRVDGRSENGFETAVATVCCNQIAFEYYVVGLAFLTSKSLTCLASEL
jgi:hypothetical protein